MHPVGGLDANGMDRPGVGESAVRSSAWDVLR